MLPPFDKVVILLLITNVGWIDKRNVHFSCSRDKSRIVRNIVYKKIVPVLDRYRVQMPLDCPFHPKRDLLWWPGPRNPTTVEGSNKSPSSSQGRGLADFEDIDASAWTCPVCGETFMCAERLAVHWDEAHRPVNTQEDVVCLADYCDVMRCNIVLKKRIKNKFRWTTSSLLSATSEADPEPSFASEEDDFLNNGQSGTCNASRMASLESRCKAVIRQCTRSLLTDNLSLKDFQDIEDEFVASICSFLNCEKYWEDVAIEPRTVGTPLCVLTGIVMIGGFCLCYYIVWIIFEAPSKNAAALRAIAEPPLQVQFLQIEPDPHNHHQKHYLPHTKPVPAAIAASPPIVVPVFKSATPDLSDRYAVQPQYSSRPQHLYLQQQQAQFYAKPPHNRRQMVSMPPNRTRSSSTARTFPHHPAYYQPSSSNYNYGQSSSSDHYPPTSGGLQRTVTAPEDHNWDVPPQEASSSNSRTVHHHRGQAAPSSSYPRPSKAMSRVYQSSTSVRDGGTPTSQAGSQVAGSTRSQPLSLQHIPRPPSTQSTPYR